eukprot:2280934-Pleurochrysis_carterae.AAC.2
MTDPYLHGPLHRTPRARAPLARPAAQCKRSLPRDFSLDAPARTVPSGVLASALATRSVRRAAQPAHSLAAAPGGHTWRGQIRSLLRRS